jgi:TolB-like protein/tRNA A-37 threonylcarbamoyl transferase component Bud32/Tfp pilus assembly protein PilF
MGANHGGLTPGTTVGVHRLERLLGRGGMGAVFLAYDTRLHRQVAIKVLDKRADDSASRARLLREARNAAALNHPRICTIHEVGEADGTPFIAMEYVAGRSLRERIDEAALPPDEVVRLGIQAADALAYAHDHGVVHRDLKAANVIVSEGDRLKIVDFGLARRDDPELADATTLASVVPAGAVAGTPYAMAPEQVRGRVVDARTDIWALGVLLYEMATGARPFTGQTTADVFSSILASTPVPLPATVPAGLRAVIERCLEKEPERRYQRADDVRIALDESASGATEPRFSLDHLFRRRKLLAATASVLLAAALLFGLNAGGLRDRLQGSAVDSAPLKLAVLPLEDLSGEPDQAYFAAGMHITLITDLARIRALRVTARASALRYAGTTKSIRQIARELNVDAVLTGSVARSGNRLQITAQLIDAATERHLWTEKYDRAVRDELSLQNEIVGAIARQVQVQLTPDEQQRLTRARPVNPEAHEAYLRGMFFVNQGNPDGVKKGLALLHDAVDKDPEHALPYAYLAAGYSSLGHQPSPPPDAFARARASALKALEIDETVADAHAVLGELILYGERSWDWPAAERAFQRAIELNPGLPRAHAHYAWYHALFDRWDDALASMRRSEEVDPLTPLWPAWRGWLANAAGRFDEATGAAEKSLELNPNFPFGHGVLSLSYAGKRVYKEALAAAQKAQSFHRGPEFALAVVYARTGQPRDALTIAEELERANTPAAAAAIHALLGDRDRAFRLLDVGLKERDSNIPWMQADPYTRTLRDDTRFADLLRRMNLPLLPVGAK